MNVTTLNISAHAVKALAVRGNNTVRQVAALPSGTIRNGLILQPEAVSGQIAAVFKSGGLPRDRVVCTVNGLPFSYRILTVPRLEPAAFHEAVLRTARQEMSISPDEMYLSWQAYPAENNEWQVLVAGITRHPVDSLIKTLADAGIKPWLMDLPHLALARLSPYRDAVIVDFEKDCSNIIMIVDGVPRGMHMVPALASGASLQDQVEQVTDKLAKMIDFYNSNHPAKPVRESVKVLITGELLDDEKAFSYIQPQIGYPVEFLTATLKSLTGWPLHQNAVNAGSGLINTQPEKSAGKDAVPYCYINLDKIARANRPGPDFKKSAKKILVPLGVVAGLSLLTVSCLSQMELRETITALQTDLSRANTELVQKKAEVEKAQLLNDNIDEIVSRIADIEAGQLEMFSSKDYVDDISSIVSSMPSGLTFSTLLVNSEQITLAGISSAASSVVQFADKLEAAGRFSSAVIYSLDKPYYINESEQALNFKIIITRGQTAAGE